MGSPSRIVVSERIAAPKVSGLGLPHNPSMPALDDIDPAIDKRLTDLEVKASFSEDLVDHLNDLVARQQEQIDLLIREVGKLKDRAPDTGGGATRDPREDVPPHY
jgi:SlyX protein